MSLPWGKPSCNVPTSPPEKSTDNSLKMLGVPILFYVEEKSVGASNLYFGMIGFVFHCLPKIESSPGDRVDPVDVRSWVLIDVAVQPSDSNFLLSSHTSCQGDHALVYERKTLLLASSSFKKESSDQSSQGGDVATHRGSKSPQKFSGNGKNGLLEYTGPFTSLYVMDQDRLLVVARVKDQSSRDEVLLLLQREHGQWFHWPLLREGHDFGQKTLQSIRGVWGESKRVDSDSNQRMDTTSNLDEGQCFLWGLCHSDSGWQDRHLKIVWDFSIRPVQVQVELSQFDAGHFSIPAELESFPFKKLYRSRLFESCIQDDFQKALGSTVPESGAEQLSRNALTAEGRRDAQTSHFGNISFGGHDPNHPNHVFCGGGALQRLSIFIQFSRDYGNPKSVVD